MLRVIASAPTDLQHVLDTIAESARRLCNARGAHITRLHGDLLRVAASASGSETYVGPPLDRTYPLSLTTPPGRAIIERRVVQIEVTTSDETRNDFPDFVVFGARTTVTAPLIRDGVAIGTIGLGRGEDGPFSPAEVALLQRFADQAVIAIENARLFSELEQRNAELQASNRQVTEALEEQTATAGVLRVIASSPTDVQHVLDAIVETAARLCDAFGGFVQQPRWHDSRLVAVAQTGRTVMWDPNDPDRFERARAWSSAARQSRAGRFSTVERSPLPI